MEYFLFIFGFLWRNAYNLQSIISDKKLKISEKKL
jgi:hypothetical protein